MTKAGKGPGERCPQHQHTDVIVALLLHRHTSVYLSVTYVSVRSDFRCAQLCACVRACVLYGLVNTAISETNIRPL